MDRELYNILDQESIAQFKMSFSESFVVCLITLVLVQNDFLVWNGFQIVLLRLHAWTVIKIIVDQLFKAQFKDAFCGNMVL